MFWFHVDFYIWQVHVTCEPALSIAYLGRSNQIKTCWIHVANSPYSLCKPNSMTKLQVELHYMTSYIHGKRQLYHLQALIAI